VATLATAVALAVVFAFAAVVAGRAVALPFAGVLALAGRLLAIAGGRAERAFHNHGARVDRSMRLDGKGARVKPGHSGAGEDHFGGFIHSFDWLISGDMPEAANQGLTRERGFGCKVDLGKSTFGNGSYK
jgi:hypothetical protein